MDETMRELLREEMQTAPEEAMTEDELLRRGICPACGEPLNDDGYCDPCVDRLDRLTLHPEG